MARPVFSVLFFAQQGLTSNASVTNPGPDVWVVRDIDVFAGQQAIAPAIRVRDGSGVTFFQAHEDIFTSNWFPWRGRQVIGPGGTIEVIPDAGNWDVRISGYSLTAT